MYKFRILFDGNLYCSHRLEIKESLGLFFSSDRAIISNRRLLLKSFSPLENTREREASLDYRIEEKNKPQVGRNRKWLSSSCASSNLENDKKGKYPSRLQLSIHQMDNTRAPSKSLRDGWATFVMYSHRFFMTHLTWYSLIFYLYMRGGVRCQ